MAPWPASGGSLAAHPVCPPPRVSRSAPAERRQDCLCRFFFKFDLPRVKVGFSNCEVQQRLWGAKKITADREHTLGNGFDSRPVAVARVVDAVTRICRACDEVYLPK